MVFSTDGKIGASLNTAAVDDGFALNTLTTGNDGSELVRVIAGSAIAQYDCVHILTSGTAAPITATLAKTAGRVGFAQTALGSGETGWVHLRSSNIRVKVLASCANLVPLYTTDTAGSLDDATASLSHYLIMGVQLTAANSATISAVTAVAHGSIVRIPLNV